MKEALSGMLGCFMFTGCVIICVAVMCLYPDGD